MSLADKAALAVVTASKVVKADPTKFHLAGNRKVRLIAAVALHRTGAVQTLAEAANLYQLRSPSDLVPSALTKVHIYSDMIEPVIEALGGPKPPAERKLGYQKVEGPKGFARIADPEERRALAAKGGAAVPADKRAFAVQPGLAVQAAIKSVAERPKPVPRPTLTIDVAAQRLAAMHNENHISFRRTEQDRRVPRKIVTARLMGDPKPGQTPWAISPEDERQAMLERRLKHCHGSEKAAAIIEGQHRATEADRADRAAWAGLGR